MLGHLLVGQQSQVQDMFADKTLTTWSCCINLFISTSAEKKLKG